MVAFSPFETGCSTKGKGKFFPRQSTCWKCLGGKQIPPLSAYMRTIIRDEYAAFNLEKSTSMDCKASKHSWNLFLQFLEYLQVVDAQAHMCCFCTPYLGWCDVYVHVASHFLKAQSNNRTFAQKRNPKQFHREDTTLMLENVTHHLLGCLKENNPKKTVWINYNYTINSWALNFWTKKKGKRCITCNRNSNFSKRFIPFGSLKALLNSLATFLCSSARRCK